MTLSGRRIFVGLATALAVVAIGFVVQVRALTLAPIDLGTLGGSRSWVEGISDSGVVIGGSCTPSDGDMPTAFAWTPSGGMTSLGAGSFESYAMRVSATGLVCGLHSFLGESDYRGFVWTPSAGLVDLGLGNRALGVTPNSVVYGRNSSNHAFIWTAAGGMEDLGTLGGTFSEVAAANTNGVVVGNSSLDGNAASHAFAWTRETGMIDIGPPGVNSRATGICGSPVRRSAQATTLWRARSTRRSWRCGRTPTPSCVPSSKPAASSRACLPGSRRHPQGPAVLYFAPLRARGKKDPCAARSLCGIGSCITPVADLHVCSLQAASEERPSPDRSSSS
jgi:probable HAF family extracellular repeat protein